MADPIIIYTDGAASGNPGPGGFGVVLKAGVYRKELMAGFRRTTNNRMELTAALKGLSTLPGCHRGIGSTEATRVAGGRLFGFPVCGRCC